MLLCLVSTWAPASCCCRRVWDRQSLQCTAVVHLEDWVSSLALQPPQLAVGCGKEVLLYSLGAGGCVPALGAPLGHEDETVTTVRSSCCGRYIFLGTGEQGVCIYALLGLLPGRAHICTCVAGDAFGNT